jgi:hypothetical protein
MTWSYFTGHEALVVREASARLAPGPSDDRSEHGHPGAREANAVRYIDRLLGGMSRRRPPVYAATAARPWFLPLTAAQQAGWESRIARLGRLYREGVRALDERGPAGGFLAASSPVRDRILGEPQVRRFRMTLFAHTIEAMYSHPVYGGNKGRCCWRDIGYSPPAPYGPDGTEDVGTVRDAALEAMIEAALPVAVQALLDLGDHDG